MSDETSTGCCGPGCCEGQVGGEQASAGRAGPGRADGERAGAGRAGGEQTSAGQADAGRVGGDEVWVPDACTLPTADRAGRVAEFDGLFSATVRAAERTGPTRLRLELEPSPEAAARAAGLAAAETRCCSFFTFTLTAAGGALSLDVAVPDSQVAVLDALADRALAAAGSGPA